MTARLRNDTAHMLVGAGIGLAFLAAWAIREVIK